MKEVQYVSGMCCGSRLGSSFARNVDQIRHEFQLYDITDTLRHALARARAHTHTHTHLGPWTLDAHCVSDDSHHMSQKFRCHLRSPDHLNWRPHPHGNVGSAGAWGRGAAKPNAVMPPLPILSLCPVEWCSNQGQIRADNVSPPLLGAITHTHARSNQGQIRADNVSPPLLGAITHTHARTHAHTHEHEMMLGHESGVDSKERLRRLQI